jgi:hypothetical protein
MFDSYQFKTIPHPYFTELFTQWYIKVNNKNVKIVPANIAELLTPISLLLFTCSRVDSILEIYLPAAKAGEIKISKLDLICK